MPTGWICRSRTDGAIAEEPPIVLQYDLVPRRCRTEGCGETNLAHLRLARRFAS